jgi:hypothetical protein
VGGSDGHGSPFGAGGVKQNFRTERTMPQIKAPTELLSADQIKAFWRDGVICVRRLYSSEWIERIATALDEIIGAPSPVWGRRQPGARFHMDMNSWLTNDSIRDFVLYGPSARVAQSAFGTRRITFYYDQIFVKEEGTPNPTPWHHDFTFGRSRWPADCVIVDVRRPS